jgi:hypothetical protein
MSLLRRTLLVLPVGGLALFACTSTNNPQLGNVGSCDCGQSPVELRVPLEAPALTSARLSGACESTAPKCYGPDASVSQEMVFGEDDCRVVYVTGQDDGTCHIELRFKDGSEFVSDVDYVTSPGECAPYCRRHAEVDGGVLVAAPNRPNADGG